WLYLKGREWRATLRRMRVQAAMNPTRPSGGPRADLARWRRIRRDQMHEVNRSELDRIMGKIESSGVGSLSPDERNFLDRFSPD
ncbi:MAG: hypothetical protein GWN71_19625, partial [Gammaproteobacteria bacterium]|nr:hypothetical protein [Gemmatimonadota bacterium]NIU75698.1 hypothetical protein [Gammaproteobacteria bacterium]NIT66704.1 hypothetical protein [Gemmatimonadota bacterium]NIV23321.1 hypothetical protein [Gemmatimonadota bacterium]NIW37795.1 hypothetical protein [Gemmatimonadota bacterium]